MSSVRIPLSSRKYPNLYTIVDEEDAERVMRHSWSPLVRANRRAVYARARINGADVFLHRFLMNVSETHQQVDHIDGDGLNNTRANLRIVSNSQNLMNRGANSNNTSGFKGVFEHSQHRGRWCASVTKNGSTISCGCYSTPEAAAWAYDEAAINLVGEVALTNRALGLLPNDPPPEYMNVLHGPPIKGVSWKSLRQKWTVSVWHKRKHYYGGDFVEYPDAVRAMLDIRLQIHREGGQ